MSGAQSFEAVLPVRWFAAHEARLIWRDFQSLLTGGKPQRTALIALVVVGFLLALHQGAAYLLKDALSGGVVIGKPVLLAASGGLLMMFSLMISQAIESVTRAYYARSDLDLILSSPAPSRKLFQVRTVILTLQTISLSVLIASPLINVLIWYDGWRWLSAYLVLISLGAVATAAAVLMTLVLFRTVGPARTRLIAQIIAAVVGAGFVIALQAFAILFGQGLSRFSLFTSADTLAVAPDLSSAAWIPARSAMGEPASLVILTVLAGLFLCLVVLVSARRFGADVLATAGNDTVQKKTAVFKGFAKNLSVGGALRRKEWKLLARDPWLISQSLQQILYLVPPALLLWMNYGESAGTLFVAVPVIVMATGQLAGGLSWITISGEDAHELIETAPVNMRRILSAKIQAVLLVIVALLTPFALVLGFHSPRAAVCMLGGAAMASGCAVLIQLWFRRQMNRSMFRRRQVSSKAATLAEALVSILWALGAALAMKQWALVLIPAVLVAVILAVVYYIRPAAQT